MSHSVTCNERIACHIWNILRLKLFIVYLKFKFNCFLWQPWGTAGDSLPLPLAYLISWTINYTVQQMHKMFHPKKYKKCEKKKIHTYQVAFIFLKKWGWGGDWIMCKWNHCKKLRWQGRGNKKPEGFCTHTASQVSLLHLKDAKTRNSMMHFERGLCNKIHGPSANALSEKVLELHEKMGDRPPHRFHEARLYLPWH